MERRDLMQTAGATAAKGAQTAVRDWVYAAVTLLMLALAVVPAGQVLAFDAPPKDQGHVGSDAGGPDDQNPDDPDQAEDGDPVQVKTGNFVMTAQDFFLSSYALPTVVQRSYNSLDTDYDGPLGKGWSLSFVMQLSVVAEVVDDGGTREERINVVIRDDSGVRHTFRAIVDPTDGSITGYEAGRARFGTLVRTATNAYTWTRADGMQFRFEAGRLLDITDTNGNRITVTYDGAGRLASVTNPAGRTFTYAYNANSKLERITDPLGRTVQYAYNPQNLLTGVTNPLGHTTTFTYGAEERLATVTSPLGDLLVSNTYDSSGRVTNQFANGATYTYTYNTSYTRVRNSRGFYTDHYINEDGNPIRRRDLRGFNSYFTWDDDGNLLSHRDQRNFTTSFTYDARGNMLSRAQPDGAITTYTYNALSRPTSITDALGRTSTLTYDPRGNLVGTTDPLGQTETFTYDTAGRVLTATDKAGAVATYAYDANGDLASYTDEAGQTTTYTYDAVGRRLTVTDALGNTTTYAYDARDRLLSRTDALGQAANFVYDANNDLVSHTDALGHTWQYTYTPYGFVSSMTDPLGNTWTYEYDSLSNMTASVDPDGRRSTMTYDAGNLLSGVTRPDATSVAYAYDPARNQASITDPRGNVTSFQHDQVNRRTRISYADGSDTALVYNLVGLVTQLTDRAGQVFVYDYDDLDRLTTQNLPNDGVITQSYNPRDSVVQVSGYAGTVQYGYDPLQRLTSQTGVWGETVNYAYDAADRLVQVERPSRYAVSYTYDADDRLTQATAPSGTATYVHDDADRLVRENLPNGVSVLYEYDDADRVTLVTHLAADGSTVLLSHAYEYDGFGLVRAMTDGDGVRTEYTYTDLYRLTSETERDSGGSVLSVVTYTYDANGNRLTQDDNGTVTTYAYNEVDELQSDTDTLYTYDDNGNLTSAATAGGTVTFTYDDLDRLTSISGGGLVSSSFVYDGEGRRVQRILGSAEQRFVYSERTLVEEFDGSGVPAVRYDHLYGLSAVDEGLGPQYYHFDGLGNTRALSDGIGGITDTYDYRAFGENVTHLGAARNPFVYNGAYGYYAEGQAELYHVGARYLDANVGRFIQSDPRRQGHNPYLYAFASPVVMNDPSGEIIPFLIGACLRGAASGAIEDEVWSRLDGSHKTRSNWDRAGSAALGCITGGFGNKARRAGRAVDKVSDAVRRAPCCFIEGTSILTAEGSKRIEQVEVGDLVMAMDPEDGELRLRAVEDIFVRPLEDVDSLLRLTISSPTQTEELLTTGEHPFWVVDEQRWVEASELEVGSRLVNHAGETLVLDAKERETQPRQTYNFAVDGLLTYFAGDIGVLVHNCKVPKGARKPGSAGVDRTGKDFTPKTKRELDAENAARNGGVNRCEDCGVDVVPGQRSQRGVTPPGNERQRDHIIPKSKGGDGTVENGQILCRTCNLNKRDNL